MLKVDSKHPCFNVNARHQYGRLHLPVAPKCNIQCNYCNRKFDCVNESRPGVSSAILSSGQAVYYVERTLRDHPEISTIGIAGPGDPLANPRETLETIKQVKAKFSEMIFCLASNGLNLPSYIPELADLGVSHVTITINAVDPDIGKSIYTWVRDGKVIYRGKDSAMLLWERQRAAIIGLKERGITVKVNSIIIPGVNDDHLEEVARKIKSLGADLMNCIPIYPAAGTVFENLKVPGAEEISWVRRVTGKYLPQMEHCTRCRADAVGFLGLGKELTQETITALRYSSAMPLNPHENRPYIAVASLEGMLVNQHLGEAEELLIYGKNQSGYYLVDTRRMPSPGGGKQRWLDLAAILKDCRVVLVSATGESPREVLKQKGIRVIETEGLIEQGLEAVFSGREDRLTKRKTSGCIGCKGSGTDCG